MRFLLVELGVLRSLFFTSLSLLAYCSVACHFCCRVVAFYILSLSCHLPWVVFFSEIHCFRLYILDKSKFLLCFFTWCYDYIFRLLPCIVYVLFISNCNTPNLFWSDNWDSFTMFESFNFSVSDFFFGLCLSYFLCQKTLSLQLHVVDDGQRMHLLFSLLLHLIGTIFEQYQCDLIDFLIFGWCYKGW